jgi:hypothetical protein
MTHLDDDRLLLFAYGELPEAAAAETEAHLRDCAVCSGRFERLERARVAALLVVPEPGARRKAGRVVAWAGLAAAAAIAGVVLARPGDLESDQGWQPPSVWSATAGYIAGGPSVVEIDAQLTRLEKERYYGLPN